MFLFYINILRDVFSIYDAEVKWSSIGVIGFFISMSFSVLIGGVISKRVERKKLLILWIVTGIITPIFFIVFQDLIVYIILTILLGTSFGIGFPSCNALIVDNTPIEELGRVYGIAYFILLFTLAITGLIFESPDMELKTRILLLLCLSCFTRLIGLYLLRLYPDTSKISKERSWSSILTTNRFLLYFIPWVIVSLMNAVIQLVNGVDNEPLVIIITYLGMICFTLLSGIIADRFGRRNTIMFGLIALGINSIMPVALSPLLNLINAALSGISFGFMQVAYATIFGDYGSNGSIEKVFAIGSSVLFLTMTLDPFSDVFKIQDTGIISTILTIAVFLSILIIIYAPETLPEDKLRTRKLNEYLKKVKRLIESEK
jgi:MFS family permease